MAPAPGVARAFAKASVRVGAASVERRVQVKGQLQIIVWVVHRAEGGRWGRCGSRGARHGPGSGAPRAR
jgi:hypothetical protein